MGFANDVIPGFLLDKWLQEERNKMSGFKYLTTELVQKIRDDVEEDWGQYQCETCIGGSIARAAGVDPFFMYVPTQFTGGDNPEAEHQKYVKLATEFAQVAGIPFNLSGEGDFINLDKWNDRPERTKEEVLATIDKVMEAVREQI